MFKTDEQSLEELSFAFGKRDIANLKKVLEFLKSKGLLTISEEEAEKAIRGLDEIGKLKLDGRVYGFRVCDNFAGRESSDIWGVELYLRQGDRLREFCVTETRDRLPQVEDAVESLKKKDIYIIYTGQIPYNSKFLGIPQQEDEEDLIIREALDNYEINRFKSGGIKVVKLDSLI